MRRQSQPGPAGAERLTIVAGRARSFGVTLHAGMPINAAIGQAMRAQGCRGGVLELEDCDFAPLRFVMPATSADPRYAAFYSATHEAAAPARCGRLCVTYGERDGAPFTHLHGHWTEAGGRPQAGHILPLEAMLAAPAFATAWVIEGSGFIIRPDAETNFSLFVPEHHGAALAEPDGALVKIQPNMDACGALEAACAQLGWANARVRGGVGSLVGTRFADGRRIDRVPTEALVRQGGVTTDPATNTARAHLDLLVVDDTGRIEAGPILHGDNPVLMTFELLLTRA